MRICQIRQRLSQPASSLHIKRNCVKTSYSLGWSRCSPSKVSKKFESWTTDFRLYGVWVLGSYRFQLEKKLSSVAAQTSTGPQMLVLENLNAGWPIGPKLTPQHIIIFFIFFYFTCHKSYSSNMRPRVLSLKFWLLGCLIRKPHHIIVYQYLPMSFHVMNFTRSIN